MSHIPPDAGLVQYAFLNSRSKSQNDSGTYPPNSDFRRLSPSALKASLSNMLKARTCSKESANPFLSTGPYANKVQQS